MNLREMAVFVVPKLGTKASQLRKSQRETAGLFTIFEKRNKTQNPLSPLQPLSSFQLLIALYSFPNVYFCQVDFLLAGGVTKLIMRKKFSKK